MDPVNETKLPMEQPESISWSQSVGPSSHDILVSPNGISTRGIQYGGVDPDKKFSLDKMADNSTSYATYIIIAVVFIFAIVALILNGFGLSFVLSSPSTVIVNGQIVETSDGPITGLGITQMISIILVLILIVFIWFMVIRVGYKEVKEFVGKQPVEKDLFFFNPVTPGTGKSYYDTPQPSESDSVCPKKFGIVKKIETVTNAL